MFQRGKRQFKLFSQEGITNALMFLCKHVIGAHKWSFNKKYDFIFILS